MARLGVVRPHGALKGLRAKDAKQGYCMSPNASVRQNHAIRSIEFVSARDHHLVAGGEAIQDLDLLDARVPEPHRLPLGDVTAHDVHVSTSALIEERPPIDHQYIRAP